MALSLYYSSQSHFRYTGDNFIQPLIHKYFLCSFPLAIINTNNKSSFCTRQFNHSNMVRIQEEEVLGTRNPRGFFLLEMGSLPECVNYISREDKIKQSLSIGLCQTFNFWESGLFFFFPT